MPHQFPDYNKRFWLKEKYCNHRQQNNKDVYIYRSFRKENGKASSCIYKKLGKYNLLLEQFDGDEDRLMVWAKEQAAKETELYKQHTGKVSVEFSKAATIPMNERRSFNVGYLFLQELCTQLRLDKVCRNRLNTVSRTYIVLFP